jgi:hypothetical protein
MLKRVNGWPDPNGLTKEQLVALVMSLQGILWGDEDCAPDPDKEWDSACDMVESVGDTLTSYGLKP